MKRCIVIGGGFAGLSASVTLSKAGFNVTLLESSQKLGGRAYSFVDKETGDIIDNGQHILMGCYNYTLDFLEEIGAGNNLLKQHQLKITFLKKNFEIYNLSAPSFPYPLNLILALLKFKAFSKRDKLRLILFFLKLPFYSNLELEKMSVQEWLNKEKQSDNAKKSFWEILVIGALNTGLSEASARIFAEILKEMFLNGKEASAIYIPNTGLSDMYCFHAEKYLQLKGSKVATGEHVKELKIINNQVLEILTSKRNINEFDYVISAVPFYSYEKINPNMSVTGKHQFEYSTILTIHIWLNNNFLDENFYGLIDSPIHWIFNHRKYITLVISNANVYKDMDNNKIFGLIAGELFKYTGISKDSIYSYKIIKEKKATFVPSKVILNIRPSSVTYIRNLFLAGDWINTGLPSTIESAVKSGKIAAQKIIDIEKNINSYNFN